MLEVLNKHEAFEADPSKVCKRFTVSMLRKLKVLNKKELLRSTLPESQRVHRYKAAQAEKRAENGLNNTSLLRRSF